MAGFTDWMFGTADTAYADAKKRQQGYNETYQGTVKQALQPYETLTDVGKTKQLQNDYVGGLENLDTQQYKVGAPTYDTSSVSDDDVQRLIDPVVAYQKESARKALESSAAGKGGLFSSGLGKSVATSDEQLSAQAYQSAYEKALAEKNRQNTIKQQQFGTDTTAGTYNLGMDTTGINAKGQALTTMMEPMGVYAQGMMDMAGTQYGADTGVSQQGMQMQGQDTGMFNKLLGAGTNFLTTKYGGK